MTAVKISFPTPFFLRSAGLAYFLAGLSLGGGFLVTSDSMAFFVRLLTCLSLIWLVIAVQGYARAARSKTMRVGAFLFLLGSLGLVTDAFFVQGFLTWFFLISFVVGSTTYSAGFYHIDATSPWAKRIFIMGLVWGVFSQLVCLGLTLSPVWVLPVFICFWVLGLCWQGVEILTCFRYKEGLS